MWAKTECVGCVGEEKEMKRKWMDDGQHQA